MSLGGDDGYGGDYGGQGPARSGGRGDRLTRTRLPEGDGGDPYGPPRRPTGRSPRSSRNLITVVGVVVLLIAAIAFANRGGGGGDGGDTADKSGSGDTASGTGPTAPTGEHPVTDKDKTTQIASGFAKTEQGAQSAAANYAVALTSGGMVEPDARHALVAQVFTGSAADSFQKKLDKAYTPGSLSAIGLDKNGKAPSGMTYVSRTAPIGTKVTDFKDTSATVEVWCTGAFGVAGESSKNPVANDWFTTTLELRWTGGDWKADSFSQKDGPAPVNSDRVASGADEIAKAAEQFGGFTYAR